MSDELDYDPNENFMDFDAYEREEQEKRERFDAAVQKINEGFDDLHKLGKFDYLLTIADWLHKQYDPPPKPVERGHNPKRLGTDQAFSQVFWEWLDAPRGKQVILKRNHKRLGYSSWQSLQAKFFELKRQLSDSAKTFGPMLFRWHLKELASRTLTSDDGCQRVAIGPSSKSPA